jgi:hypothetical protein
MHTIAAVNFVISQHEAGSPIEPEMIEQFRNSALVARDRHAILAGRSALSVNEHGEPPA